VTYDVYCQSDLPGDSVGGGSPTELAAARKKYVDDNYQRFAKEFAALKKLVEKTP
jgi:hypothetical protein